MNMDQLLQILVKTVIDVQKEQQNLDKQLQKIKLNAIKVGIVYDDRTIKEVQKQVSEFNKKNLNGIDYEIKKREEQGRIQTNLIKAQMQVRAEAEKKNISAIDFEIKKREQASKSYATQIKAQMEARIAEENVIKVSSSLDNQRITAANKLQIYMNTNTRAVKDFASEFTNLSSQLKPGMTEEDIQSWNEQFLKLTSTIRAAGAEGSTAFEKLTKNTAKFASWLVTSGGVMLAISSIKSMVTAVVELDKSFTEIQKVTSLAGDSLDKFTIKAFKIGETIGRTGKEVVDAVSIFARAGYDIDSSLGLSKAALVMTNVGDGISNVEEASSALIAVLKGFRDLSDSDAMRIVDMINETSNTQPIDFDNITEGLRRVSGTMAQTGTSIEETIGLLTGGFGQLRDIEMVSSGLIMISQRLRGIDEDGQAIDGLAPKLAKDFKDIADIDIEDGNGELRDTYAILADMARVFPTLTSEQRQYLGELAAGNVALCVAKAA